MEFRSALDEVKQAVSSLVASDIATLSGTDASTMLSELVVVVRQLSAVSSSCASRAIEANQHNADGATSAAAWLSSRTGVSRKTARSLLSFEKKIADMPCVRDRVLNGSLSVEQAKIIVHNADGDLGIALQLLSLASSLSVEELREKAQELITSAEDADERRERRRRDQYVTMGKTSSGMEYGKFLLLPENASFKAAWQEFAKAALQENDKLEDPLPVHVAEAEAWGRFLSGHLGDGGDGDEMSDSGGSSKPARPARSARPTLTYHFDVNAGVANLVGVGAVPKTVIDNLDDPLIRLVLTYKNKLIWYAEPDYRDKELPENIKRAVKAAAKHQCQTPGCTERATEVDHIKARTNGGGHELENLQALCARCHAAKTIRDAPWTIGKYFRVGEDDPAKAADSPSARDPVNSS